jgi:arylformamidase
MSPAGRVSAGWLEAQYNNRARVPEAAQILSRWADESARARGSQRCELDVAYGEAASERLDIFPAACGQVREPAPVLVFIHGGWWRALDKADHSFVAPALTAAGAAVVIPNYALCPAVRIDDIALQMTRALAWVWRHAAEFGGDARRIVVAGHSAGGHLAALLLTCRWQQVDRMLPAQLLQGALAVSGVFDLEPLRRTPFLQRDLRLTPASARRLSPIHMPAPRAPLLAVAGADESKEFARHVAAIADAWGPAAVPVHELVPGANHFTALDELSRPTSRVHALARGLLGVTGLELLSK